MKKRIISLLTVVALVMTFVCAYAITGDEAYAASKSKKYALPKDVVVYYYDEDGYSRTTKMKYDKYGNLKSALLAEMIPIKITSKYRKKGVLASASLTDGDTVIKKYYDKKGRINKLVYGDDIFTYKFNKKGLIKKVTLNGKTYYTVKKFKYHKNGFVSKIVYNNGNINKYNSNGLLTTAIDKKAGKKYTYKYTKKKGKIVKILVKCNGKNYKKITLKYGKATTKDVWKYSATMNYADGPSNAAELYPKSPLSSVNSIFW